MQAKGTSDLLIGFGRVGIRPDLLCAVRANPGSANPGTLKEMSKPLILVVCTANSARSQMAEGLMRHLKGDQFEVASAGTLATYVRPQAIEALVEIGIDISHHTSKTIDGFLDKPIRYLITVCDNARDNCPYVPGAQTTLHWPFPDPATNPRLEDFRAVRDMIRAKIESTELPL